MLKHSVILLVLLLGFSQTCHAQKPEIPDDVKENIVKRVEKGSNTGIVVGMVNSHGTTFYSYGVKSSETKEPVDEYTTFEIGSISKAFTGILLADMVVKGEVSMETPLQKLLPDGITSPTRNGDTIRLVHLANHTSSLPRMPDNMNNENPANPYFGYTEKHLYDFLDGYELTRDIGSKQEYSNYAMGLLGEVLAAKCNSTYEELMVQRIAKPLNMKNTRITFTPNMYQNLAMGHSLGLEVENWDLGALGAGGAIRSTATDMLKFIAANMGIEKSKLLPAMQLSYTKSSEQINGSVGLGWHTRQVADMELVWHNGGTGGYRSFSGFINGGDLGVVILSNSNFGVDNIGFHLLNAKLKLKNIKPSIGNKLNQIFAQDGINKAVKSYWNLKKNHQDEFNFKESELDKLGAHFYIQGQIKEARAIFWLNVKAFPDSWRVYDNYAFVLMESNKKRKAITNYKKLLDLNPDYEYGIEMLKKLGVDIENIKK
ncbi:serine hydrolase domain-containing protein [Algibacter agarivorans]|uniref:Beta-lactamase n=1 Tax=Algibacter agarivorans TaxID=1109741 RepID=A0ABP9GKK4_9FLAO